ncbi:hypothetical protein [Phaffia rhodozyma]|uniref:Uncharacterized protein n=1 Tax=Phaffia rhodozyma TaxID=264483 RepID=A0A0F7SFE6_PHARH|nr:hypothetical protein [Phaffia rhodozyma]
MLRSLTLLRNTACEVPDSPAEVVIALADATAVTDTNDASLYIDRSQMTFRLDDILLTVVLRRALDQFYEGKEILGQLNVPSSPSPVNRTVSTIMFSRAKRIKLAKRVRQTQLVNMINQINHIKKINKINKINKTDKTKKIKNIKKVESYRMTSKPVFVLPSVKLFRSSSRAAWASPTTKSSLGKRIRHHSADPSIKLCDEPARSNKKPKQWAENSLDLEGSPSVPAQRPQSVNIPSWIEARRNEHQEQSDSTPSDILGRAT